MERHVSFRRVTVDDYAVLNEDFWADFAFVYNDEDPDLDFVNPIAVQDHFIEVIAQSARLGEVIERLTEDVADLESELNRAQRSLNRLRRNILARHWEGVSKSASSELQDAFIQKCAIDFGEEHDLFEAEEYVALLEDDLARAAPLLTKAKYRLRRLEQKMEWAKQYLDYDKLLARLQGKHIG